MRNTIQRKLVFEAMQKLAGHATAEEIHAEISRRYPAISKATVYRNLNALADRNIILRVHVPNGADRFDCRISSHQHACCTQCGKIYDIEIPGIDSPLHDAARQISFKLDDYQIFLYGLCPACQPASSGASPLQRQ